MSVRFYDSKTSFAAGELSPILAARADLSSYGIGAKELVNAFVLPQGGFVNRPGTQKFAQGAAYAGARLIPFEASDMYSYCLVFRTDGLVEGYDESGKRFTVAGNHPYGPAQLAGLRLLQSIDVLYLFHQTMPVYKLMHYSDTNWVFQQADFKNGPFLDANYDESKKMALSGSRLSSNFDIFSAPMIGQLVKLTHKIKASSGVLWLSGDGASGTVTLFGASTLESTGVWKGIVYIYRKEPDDTDWPTDPIYTYDSDEDYNFQIPLSEDDFGVEYKVIYSGSGKTEVRWASGGGLTRRILKISSLVSSRSVVVTSDSGIHVSVPYTADWSVGAFGGTSGYPKFGAFHQERLVLANTVDNPHSAWMSKSASWEDFGDSIPVQDTDAIMFTLATKQLNEIVAMSSQQSLLIFTTHAEFAAKSSGNKGDVLTPESLFVLPSGYVGSHDMDILEVGNMTLHVQRHGKAARSVGYQLDIDGYSSSDTSILSSHLFEGTKAARWAYQQSPYSIVWIALENGVVLTLTLQKEHQVTAWTRQIFNGHVSDICAVSGATQDEIFMIVGDTLAHLNHRVDTAGGFTDRTYLDEGTTAYTTSFESLEMEQNVNGTLQGRFKQVPGATIRVFRTTNIKAGIVTENSAAMDELLDGAAPFTGDLYPRLPGGAGRSCRIRIENDKPGPLTVLGIMQEVNLSE